MTKKKTNKNTVVNPIKTSDIKLFFKEGYYVIVYNILFFVGIILTFSSLLSFDHHRSCDGGLKLTDHYSCTNPAFYYEYSIDAIVVFVVGILLMAFWYLKRNTQIYYGDGN